MESIGKVYRFPPRFMGILVRDLREAEFDLKKAGTDFQREGLFYYFPGQEGFGFLVGGVYDQQVINFSEVTPGLDDFLREWTPPETPVLRGTNPIDTSLVI